MDDSNNIDQVSPISAVKVSGITPVKIHNDQGGLDIEALNRVDDRSILYMRDSDLLFNKILKLICLMKLLFRWSVS